jgi:predicted DNA-binding protein
MQKSCIVTFRCTESELERLTALADVLDRTRAWIAREIIFGKKLTMRDIKSLKKRKTRSDKGKKRGPRKNKSKTSSRES